MKDSAELSSYFTIEKRRNISVVCYTEKGMERLRGGKSALCPLEESPRKGLNKEEDSGALNGVPSLPPDSLTAPPADVVTEVSSSGQEGSDAEPIQSPRKAKLSLRAISSSSSTSSAPVKDSPPQKITLYQPTTDFKSILRGLIFRFFPRDDVIQYNTFPAPTTSATANAFVSMITIPVLVLETTGLPSASKKGAEQSAAECILCHELLLALQSSRSIPSSKSKAKETSFVEREGCMIAYDYKSVLSRLLSKTLRESVSVVEYRTVPVEGGFLSTVDIAVFDVHAQGIVCRSKKLSEQSAASELLKSEALRAICGEPDAQVGETASAVSLPSGDADKGSDDLHAVKRQRLELLHLPPGGEEMVVVSSSAEDMISCPRRALETVLSNLFPRDSLSEYIIYTRKHDSWDQREEDAEEDDSDACILHIVPLAMRIACCNEDECARDALDSPLIQSIDRFWKLLAKNRISLWCQARIN